MKKRVIKMLTSMIEYADKNQSDRLQKVLKKKLHSCRESELVAIAMLLKVDL